MGCKIVLIGFMAAVFGILVPMAALGADGPVETVPGQGGPKDFFDQVGETLGSIKDYVLDRSPAGGTMENLKAVRELLDLPDERKAWLVRTTPELLALMNNASLKAVMGNEALLDRMAKASQGSLAELYEIAKDPLIANLFKDKDFSAALKRIDLKALSARAKASTPADSPSHSSLFFGMTCVPSHPQRVR